MSSYDQRGVSSRQHNHAAVSLMRGRRQYGLFRLDITTGELERISAGTQSSITGVAVRNGGTIILASTNQGQVARINRPFPW